MRSRRFLDLMPQEGHVFEQETVDVVRLYPSFARYALGEMSVDEREALLPQIDSEVRLFAELEPEATSRLGGLAVRLSPEDVEGH